MARKDRKLELLRKVALFAPCGDKELRKIASLVDQVDVPEDKVLTREGTPGHEFFVVAEGNAKVTLRGKKLGAGELGPGAFFGEMSLLDQGPRSATITATTPMTLYVLDARSFSRFLDEAPTVAKKIMKGLAQRLRDVEKAPTYQH
jgi:CRP/FNR family cyclic AMP-dependent transcriptional regulator